MFAFSIAGTAITEQHTSLVVSQQRRLVSSLNHWKQTGSCRFVKFAARKELKIIIGLRMLYSVASQNHGLNLTFVKNVIPSGIKSLHQTSNMKTRHNIALNRSAVIMRFCLFSFPCRARLALR